MILVSSRGAVSDPVLRGLDNSRPLVYPPAYPIYSARSSTAGRESGLPQCLSSPSYVSSIAAAPACEKTADSSARILRLGLRIEHLFTAICANLKGCLLFLGNLLRRVPTIVRPQTALFQQLTIYPPESGNRPGGRCAASCGKTSKIPQAFHRLWNKSCGPSGTPRICARATPNYSGGGAAPSAIDSNRVELFRKAMRMVPVGPLRCLRMRISATPSSSGSSGL